MPAAFETRAFDNGQYAINPRCLRLANARCTAAVLRRPDPQREKALPPAFLSLYDGRRIGPKMALSRRASALDAALDAAPGPQLHAAPVAGRANRPLHRPGSSAFISKLTRAAPVNAAEQKPRPRLGPGTYSPPVPMSRLQRAFGDWDPTIPGGFGRAARSGAAPRQDEEAEQPGRADPEEEVAPRVPTTLAYRGPRFGVPSGRRQKGALDALASTPVGVGPGTYHSSESFMKAVAAHTPHAAVIGKDHLPPTASGSTSQTIGPSTYDPFAPLGAPGARETTPSGSGGLHYSFSAASFFTKAARRRPTSSPELNGIDEAELMAELAAGTRASLETQ